MPGTLASSRQVVHAVVAGAVRPGDPGAIDAEDHWQAVQRDVEDDLIPRSIEERRVDRHDRPHSAHRHACCCRDGVLFGDANVEEAVGKALLERDQPGRPGHRRGDRHDAVVRLSELDDRLGKGLGVTRRDSFGRPDRRVEHGSVMEVLLVVVLRRWVATALLGDHVDDDRPLCRQLDGVAQRRFEFGDVVPVDRADVADPERFEERRRLEQLARRCLDSLDGALGRIPDERDVADELFELALTADVDRVQTDLGEEVRQRIADPADDRGGVRSVGRPRCGRPSGWRSSARSCARCR